MKKKIFSIPFNGDLELTKWAIDSGQVKEVYFASPSKNTWSLLCDPSPHFYNEDTIKKLLKICKDKEIETNLLINQLTLINEDLNECIKYIKSLKYISSITIGDLLVVDFFIKTFPKLDIQSSIITSLYSVNMIENLLKRGVGTISLPPEFSRNFQMLKVLNCLKKRYPKFKIKLFISYTCFSDCPFMYPHFASRFFRSIIPIKSIEIKAYTHKDYCMMIPDRAQFIKRPFVRPEDVKYLIDTKFVDYLKIVYRFDDSETLYKKFNAYFNRNYNGDLFEIISYPYTSSFNTRLYCDNKKFPKNFFKKVFHCKKLCFDCNYCDRVASLVLSKKISAH